MTAVGRLPSGRRCGYWLPEVAYPWLALEHAGWDVVCTSTRNVMPVAGGIDRSDPVQRRFVTDRDIQHQLSRTRRIDNYRADEFGVVVVAGGAGALLDLPDNEALRALTEDVAAAGGLLAACGHGSAGLANVRSTTGTPLVHGHRLTCTSRSEERHLELDTVLPFSLIDTLTTRGAECDFGDPFVPHVVRDGQFITGQNPASAPELARILVNATASPK